ncbi:MAG TPA: protein kinase [Polyangiaceae bacterium]|nr:protein kinase [Polyangiaceae bacterium]
MSHVLDLTEGAIFAQQFRVIRPLAQGGMGAVYIVEQLSTGKKRALKLMLPSAAAVDGTRRFEQEARTSSLIPSEHVVDVIAAGVEGVEQVPWLAMELLEGESLEIHLLRSGALSATQSYEILVQLAHALSAAHDIDVVHRDIKPDNVFLARARNAGSEFMVKVLDFGLATVVVADTRNTTALGSPLWMAPEQAQQDEPISLATDVWAFGLLAFRMLSGQIFWTASDGSLHQLLRELMIDPIPPASQRAKQLQGAELPGGFDDWFSRCVARSPALRFQHARDAWLALEPVLEAAGAQVSRRSPFSEPPPGQALRVQPSVAPKPLEAVSTKLTSTDDVRVFLDHAKASSPPLSASAGPVSFAAPSSAGPNRKRLIVPVLALCLAFALLLVWRLNRANTTATAPAVSAPYPAAEAHATAPVSPTSDAPAPVRAPEPALEPKPAEPVATSNPRANARAPATHRPNPAPAPVPAAPAATAKARPQLPDLL